jgi:excisionase family DNA binding protein
MRENSQLALDIAETAKRLSLSPRTVASLVKTGELGSLKVGRRRIIPVSAIESFLTHDHPTEITKSEDQ